MEERARGPARGAGDARRLAQRALVAAVVGVARFEGEADEGDRRDQRGERDRPGDHARAAALPGRFVPVWVLVLVLLVLVRGGGGAHQIAAKRIARNNVAMPIMRPAVAGVSDTPRRRASRRPMTPAATLSGRPRKQRNVRSPATASPSEARATGG